MIDDKPRIHAAVKTALGNMVTTVMVRQGKYAFDTEHHYDPHPELTVESIEEVRKLTVDRLRGS